MTAGKLAAFWPASRKAAAAWTSAAALTAVGATAAPPGGVAFARRDLASE